MRWEGDAAVEVKGGRSQCLPAGGKSSFIIDSGWRIIDAANRSFGRALTSFFVDAQGDCFYNLYLALNLASPRQTRPRWRPAQVEVSSLATSPSVRPPTPDLSAPLY
jgi:hypothetical protein